MQPCLTKQLKYLYSKYVLYRLDCMEWNYYFQHKYKCSYYFVAIHYYEFVKYWKQINRNDGQKNLIFDVGLNTN